jgi:hypothetical protein
MNSADARDQVEMIDRILSASSRRLDAGGEFFVVWGVASAAMDLIVTLILAGRLPPAAAWINAIIVVASVAFTVARAGYYRKCGRMSFLQREYLNVLWLAVAVTFVCQFIAFKLFAPTAQIALWNIAMTIVLFYVGMHGNRRAQIGGIVLLVSIALANFIPQYSGYILAGGVFLGYGGFGVAELLGQ